MVTTSGRQRLTVLLLLGTGFMLSADFSILNVALPKLGAGVGLRESEPPWVISAFALPAAVSRCCSGLLLTARTFQGLATAIASPAALSLLITSFSDERQRARVLGLNGTLLVSGFTRLRPGPDHTDSAGSASSSAPPSSARSPLAVRPCSAASTWPSPSTSW